MDSGNTITCIGMASDDLQRGPVRQYYGLKAIAERMGWAPCRVTWYVELHGFLAYRRRKPGLKRTVVWYTDENLILTWQMNQAAKAQEWLRQKHNRKEQVKSRYPGLQQMAA